MMQIRLRNAGNPRPAAKEYKFLLPAVLLPLLLHCSPGRAQGAPDLQYLIFDAVPIALVEPAGTGNAAYQANELLPLPAANAVDLHSWLASRQLSQPEEVSPSLADDIARYENSIAAIELAGGPYDPRLDQELLALSALYQQAGQFSRALTILERATHINRVNNGLYNLGQIPLVERAIENHLARGDLLSADTQHEYLFYLQRKSLGTESLDLLPALTRFAEWNVFAFNARPQLLALPAAPTEDGAAAETVVTTLETLQVFRARRLVNAQNIYQAIIQILVNNFGPHDPRLLDFEMQLALTNYFFATTFDPMADAGPLTTQSYSNVMPYETTDVASNSLGYRQGKEALERRIRYLEERDNVAAIELARAHVDLGDWLLRFRKRSGALEEYASGYQLLQDAGLAQKDSDALFKPLVPVQVPSFLIHSYSRAAYDIPDELALSYKGHIDVEFSINRFGAPGAIKVLGKSDGTHEAVESRLLRTLRRNSYRPRHDAGVVRDLDTILLRYYYTW